jgi:hypothetical protein
MRPPEFLAETIEDHFLHHPMATLKELEVALGSPSSRTVFRKLKALDYLSSYTHRGRYYTLQSIATFDEQGLWSCRSVWFSQFGNLLDTAVAFVERSGAGYTAAELSEALHVECKHTLVDLVRRRRLQRERIDHLYVYFSSDRTQHNRQRRERLHHRASMSLLVGNPDLAVEEAKAAVVLFLGTLNEQQRRLYAGLESLKIGHGGDEHIADLFGLDRHTIARGREELLRESELAEGVRQRGAGRPAVEKKRLKS